MLVSFVRQPDHDQVTLVANPKVAAVVAHLLVEVGEVLQEDVSAGGSLPRDAYAEDRFRQLTYEMGAGATLDGSRAEDLQRAVDLLQAAAASATTPGPARLAVTTDDVGTLMRATNHGRLTMRSMEQSMPFHLLTAVHASCIDLLSA